MKSPKVLLVPASLGLLLSACAASPPGTGSVALLEAGTPSSAQVEAIGSLTDPLAAPTNWKERMAQPYVFLEKLGDYRDLGEPMRRLLALAESQGVRVTGAPFALFYEDPGRVPVSQLRARVCLPVDEQPRNAPGLSFDVLDRAMVAYTRVSGPYPDVARVYPALFRFMSELHWSPGAPIREIYLVNPAQAETFDELVTEVQVPWSFGG